MEWTEVQLSVDLVRSAQAHLRFLDYLDDMEAALKGDALQHGLKRYEQLWLPLAYKHRDLNMVAPADIAWFWYIHMLKPLAYRRDCRKIFKNTLDHKFPDKQTIIPNMTTAIEVWYETYPKEGFNIIRNGAYVRPNRNKGQVDMSKPSKLSIDLVAFADSHMEFCYQVALPHFRDRQYLESALKRYKQFLCMKRMEPNEFLTPSVDILLMWYTHMCNPVAYAKDTEKVCGAILANNVVVRRGIMSERYLTARQKTKDLWKKVSKEDYVKSGTLLRSSTDRNEIFTLTTEDLQESCVVTYNIYLTHADISGLPKHIRHIDLQIFLVNANSITSQEIASYSGTRSSLAISKSVVFNTINHKGLQICLYHSSRFLCSQTNSTIARCSIDVRKEVAKLRPMERAVSLDVTMESERYPGIKFQLDGAVDQAFPVLCDLRLQTSAFTRRVLNPEQLQKILGHNGIQGVAKYTCSTATHILLTHEDASLFKCKVTHIPEVLHSGVEIYYKNKLVATSGLIGSSQLPAPDQVQKGGSSLAFDPELGERAMLIRNSATDWGICVARWNQEKGSKEGLEVRFMKLGGKNTVQCFNVTNADMEFQSFNASLFSGRVMINPRGNVVAENLALVMSISVLHVLCSPDSTIRQIPMPVRRARAASEADTKPLLSSSGEEEDIQSIQTPPNVPEVSCKFLMAAGLQAETPTNSYVQLKFGSLTGDLLLDTQDVVVEEEEVDKKLLKKESKISLCESETGDLSTSPRKKKKKHKSSKSLSNHIPSLENVKEGVASDVPTSEKQTGVADDKHLNMAEPSVKAKTEPKVVPVKVKKVKKRQSSKLEDMLAMSDDSITKDEVETVKLVKAGRGKKFIVRKISSNIDEEIKLVDSMDEDEKEVKEFLDGLNETPDDNMISKEHTTLIKEVAEKKKRINSETFSQESALTEVENDRVVFNLGDSASMDSGHGGQSQDDPSDVSTLSKENKSLRQKIEEEREQLYPLSDEDSGREKQRRLRKKKKKHARHNEDHQHVG